MIYKTGMDPEPVAVGEHLQHSDHGRCTGCRCWLYYQRVERPQYPKRFFVCRRCGTRYAAWESGWTPGRAT
jgi:hypothetical protein